MLDSRSTGESYHLGGRFSTFWKKRPTDQPFFQKTKNECGTKKPIRIFFGFCSGLPGMRTLEKRGPRTPGGGRDGTRHGKPNKAHLTVHGRAAMENEPVVPSQETDLGRRPAWHGAPHASVLFRAEDAPRASSPCEARSGPHVPLTRVESARGTQGKQRSATRGSTAAR